MNKQNHKNQGKALATADSLAPTFCSLRKQTFSLMNFTTKQSKRQEKKKKTIVAIATAAYAVNTSHLG